MTAESTAVPAESELEPWYAAISSLWDDAALYAAIAARARQIADERYREEVSRRKHVDYFTSLTLGGRPLEPHPPG
jgi:hypothetical protein